MPKKTKKGLTYARTGVVAKDAEASFKTLIAWVNKTLQNRPEVKTEVGLYATVIDIGHGQGLALSTDGVGTKLFIAQMLGRFDTVGIDCVAMNVNDLICVGARPMAMLDYIAIQNARHPLLGELGQGLYHGALQAGITIPAGEVAQLKEMVRGLKPGIGFDLVGTAVGLVDLNKLVVGQGIEEGDAVVGLASSGLHSNGYTLARKVLLSKFKLSQRPKGLGRTLGEELLEPTRIYVKPALQMLERCSVKALIHITGEGYRNLRRIRSAAGFVLDRFPEIPPIFKLIQKEGGIENTEMAHTFNLGIGLCVVVPRPEAEEVIRISREFGIPAQVIGHAVKDPEKKIVMPSLKVVGKSDRFHEES
ncbi:MAG: phosphoribosylformylglycinamidine cyclo-ligase [Deltaproteobacteria bacterium RBG_13_61_14]|nr:MAG: phosphoribosylformylglycinamidine cyclo-ligase [Deltaproteobacteria bacterium RBG_13_61_14]